MMLELLTPRLRIRSWQQADVASWGALCADPVVMRFFPKLLDRVEAAAWIDQQQRTETQHGYCFWAVELLATGELIGMTGLHPLQIEGIIEGEVEIGWRLHQRFWGQGYATEAARVCQAHARTELGTKTLYAVASEANRSSLQVMEKLGMTERRTFIHPLLPLGSALQPCMLYGVAL